MTEKTPAERLQIIARLAREGAIDEEHLDMLIKQFKRNELAAAVFYLLTETTETTPTETS